MIKRVNRIRVKKSKPKLKVKKAADVDHFENEIRANPHHYNTVSFTPGMGLETEEHKDLDTAHVHAQAKIKAHPNIRTVMVYAVNSEGRFAMHGAYNPKGEYKKVEERK